MDRSVGLHVACYKQEFIASAWNQTPVVHYII
jgi:hypothetical protein